MKFFSIKSSTEESVKIDNKIHSRETQVTKSIYNTLYIHNNTLYIHNNTEQYFGMYIVIGTIYL